MTSTPPSTPSRSDLHVVTGAGPVGSTVARRLAERGHPVRVLTRSGSGPDHPLIERRRVDVSRADLLLEHLDGAVAVHHCIHGSSYSAEVWRAELPEAEQVVLAAAGRAGAVVTFPESLYSYGPVDGPITEDSPRAATSGKLGVRADLLRARAASSTPHVSVVASDFFGPEVRNAHAGERMVPTILNGRRVTVVGSLDLPHSFTYVPDLADAMIVAAGRTDLWGQVLHAPTGPAPTQRQIATAFAGAARVGTPKLSALPIWALRAIGVFSSEMRELAETSYMFTRPFVMESARSEALLGLSPTPLARAAEATVAWWMGRAEVTSGR